MRRDVFQAIADPVRRDIVDLLMGKKLNVSEIAEHFEISRPAISRHIKILKECKIISIEQRGKERYCEVQAQNLIPAFLWVEKYQKLWEARIDSFEQYLMDLKSKNKNNE